MHYICEWTYEGDRKALKRVMVDVFPYVSWTVYVCILMSGRDKRQFRWHRRDRVFVLIQDEGFLYFRRFLCFTDDGDPSYSL